MKTPSYKPINSLLRGLEVLRVINLQERSTVGTIFKETNLPKPTIVRVLETLEHAGFVTGTADGNHYTLTAKVLSLSSGFDANDRLVEIASPILADFREKMPWPSDLAVFDGAAMVIIETNRNPGTLALNRSVGTRMSMIDSALGRAFLAFCSDGLRESTLGSLPEIDNPEAFTKMLKKFKTQGFSENDKTLSPHTRGVAVPIIVDGDVIACINTIVLTEVMDMMQVIERCVEPRSARSLTGCG